MSVQVTGGGRLVQVVARGRVLARRRIVRRGSRSVGAAVVVVLTFILLRALGAIQEIDAALQAMGFDVDRAKLLTSMTAEALVVGTGVLLTRSALGASLAGFVIGAAVFARTFADETGQASAIPSGAGTRFDPLGWMITLVTLAAAFTIVAWATATIALHVRVAILAAVEDLKAFRQRPSDRRRLVRPSGALFAIAVFGLALPVFADMLNYAPDVRMRSGGPSGPGLTDVSGSATRPGSMLSPGDGSPPALLGGSVAHGSGRLLATDRPWTAWVPSGSGTVRSAMFPAPWVGGSVRQLRIAIYLPPGYDTSTHRDPVIYEVPFDLESGWSKSVQITSMLDRLIDSGQLPPTIAVFIPEKGGPFADAECANSADGREWMDRFIVTTVVPWIDRQFRTIPNPQARAVMGFSQGGFCAAALALRHPDVFGESISLSGYYQAGIRTGQTPEAGLVYGQDPAARAASSPDVLAGETSASVARTLFFELSAKPTEPFYGPQYTEFAGILHGAGIPVALFPTAAGHAWDTVRDESPSLLATLGQRWAAAVVFQ